MADDSGLSRRGFVQGAVVSSAALFAGPGIATADPVAAGQIGVPGLAAGSCQGGELSFTTDSAALQLDSVVSSACQFCNSNCRLQVGLRANRVISVKGEERDPVQAGNICVKAPMMAQLVYNPLRLTTPLRRVGGRKGSPESR